MRVILDIKQPKDFEALIPLLRLLNIGFIKQPDSIEVVTEGPSTTNVTTTKEANKITGISSQKTPSWDFNKFYGIAKASLTLEQIDQQLNEHRKEWDRDFY